MAEDCLLGEQCSGKVPPESREGHCFASSKVAEDCLIGEQRSGKAAPDSGEGHCFAPSIVAEDCLLGLLRFQYSGWGLLARGAALREGFPRIKGGALLRFQYNG